MTRSAPLALAFSAFITGCVASPAAPLTNSSSSTKSEPSTISSSSTAMSSSTASSSTADSSTAQSSLPHSSSTPSSNGTSSSSTTTIQQPVHAINAGGATYTDRTGVVFNADDYFNNGKVSDTNDPIANTEDDDLFQTERFGDFSYQLPVDDGTYRIALYLNELYFEAANKRSFSIVTEGYTAVEQIDLYTISGHDYAHIIEQDGIAVSDGILDISTISHTDNASITAIAVWPSNTDVVNSSSSSNSNSTSSNSNSSAPAQDYDPRGHEGPLFGNLTEAERMQQYFHPVKANGTTRIEAEHFATQRYGNDDYRGARWFMVQTDNFRVKDHPEFAERCKMARQELVELDNNSVKYGGRSVRQIIADGWGNNQIKTYFDPITKGTGREDGKGVGVDNMITRWGCNPIENHTSNGFNYSQLIQAASGKSVLSLLPDMLYGNHNEAPHGASNWGPNKDQAPRVYYRVNLPKAGNYELKIRAFRHSADSGSGHYGHTPDPDMRTNLAGRVDISGTNKWATITKTISVGSAGEHYITLAGREDGFIYDYFDITPK